MESWKILRFDARAGAFNDFNGVIILSLVGKYTFAVYVLSTAIRTLTF